ncbi:hypothetical protein INH39_01385 [Massilia violaceinigra]|uniref:Uncharacterized protein n=1 Tax=Massilia violaceinigra TaxID=2045208 RepID=A0ABY4A6N6_9BURK|nr:hypothetical protein [Massilia violaceinigra]UOD30437.1 hypothetical protein INH39_01385 [Massilia violaceinigra]
MKNIRHQSGAEKDVGTAELLMFSSFKGTDANLHVRETLTTRCGSRQLAGVDTSGTADIQRWGRSARSTDSRDARSKSKRLGVTLAFPPGGGNQTMA